MRLANDANCFALSEATDGAAAGCDSVFGVILGTGVGGGIVIGGRLLAGANAIAGEWGHNPLPWPRDDELPGPRLLLRPAGLHRDLPVRARAGRRSPAPRRHRRSTAPQIAAGAAAGDPAACRATLDRYAERLARALASVINMLDPDAIVLGGGLSAIAGFTTRCRALWGAYVFSDDGRHPPAAAAPRRFERRARRRLAVAARGSRVSAP